MKAKKSSIPLLSFIFLTFLPYLISSQACQNTCGKIPIKYPFGTGPGCGDPRFQPYVSCNQQQQLTFLTHTGCYTVTSIDYNHQIMYISDPTMSTCSCTLPSKGFSLDWDSPFTFRDDTVFALLNCSTTSSPIYRNSSGYDSTCPLCDPLGSTICTLLNSCDSISRLSLPVSGCCVYTPVDLGPSFEIDLQKLKCTSYSALYGFNWQDTNPGDWKYGIALKYKFNFNNDYPELCAMCERSCGVCGYNLDPCNSCNPINSFSCNCPSGLNTTTDCFYGRWSYSSRFLPWKIRTLSVFAFTMFIILASL